MLYSSAWQYGLRFIWVSMCFLDQPAGSYWRPGRRSQNYTSCYESNSLKLECLSSSSPHLSEREWTFLTLSSSFFLLKYRETSKERSVWLTPERWRYEGRREWENSGNDSWLSVYSVRLCFVERAYIVHLFSLLWHHSLLITISVWQASLRAGAHGDAIKSVRHKRACVCVCDGPRRKGRRRMAVGGFKSWMLIHLHWCSLTPEMCVVVERWHSEAPTG